MKPIAPIKSDWVCPHCGTCEWNRDDFYFGEGCHDVTCNSCGKDYTVSVHVSLSFKATAEGKEQAWCVSAVPE